MPKRGESTLFFLFTVILALVTGLILLNIAIKIGNNEIFEQKNLADDAALAVDTLISAPGDVEYHFNRDTSYYEVLLEQDMVKVTQSGKGLIADTVSQATEKVSEYIPRSRNSVPPVPEFRSFEDHEEHIWLTKDGDIVSFADCNFDVNTFCFSAQERIRNQIMARLNSEIASALRSCSQKKEDLCVCGTFSTSLFAKDAELEIKNTNEGVDLKYKRPEIEIEQKLNGINFCVYGINLDGSVEKKDSVYLEATDEEELSDIYLFATESRKIPLLVKSGEEVCIAMHNDPAQYPQDYFYNNEILTGIGGKELARKCG